MPGPDTDLARRTAASLEKDLPRFRELGAIPSLRDLARRYRVSPVTMAKAARSLADRGLVELEPRRKMRFPAPIPPPERRPPAASALARKLREDILQGRYRAGAGLPKFAYFRVREGSSQATVARAFAELAAEGLVHKRGRSWRVGAAPRSAAGAWAAPALVIVQPKSRVWGGLRVPRTEDFVRAFLGEADRRQVELQGCTVGGLGQPGHAALERLARGLRGRYFGALVVGQPVEYADFRGLLSLLLSFRKPVAWLDKWDQAPPDLPRHRLLARCAFSEADFARAGLEYLLALGHRHFGYACDDDQTWSRERLARLRRLAEARGARVEDAASMAARSAALGGEGLAAHLAGLWARAGGRPRRALEHLHRNLVDTPPARPDFPGLARLLLRWDVPRGHPLRGLHNLVPFLLDEGITAIIAQNDEFALGVGRRLGAMGMAVPGDVSLLSYDNYLDPLALPVTTVDLGDEQLGYRAFHWISGEIPVARGADGTILARPKLVQRGSAAPPPADRGK